MCDIELPGLRGENLLAFLAALGTLRVLTENESDTSVHMRWVDHVSWRPVIRHSRLTTDTLVAELAQRVCGERSINAAWHISDDLTLDRIEFRQCMQSEGMKSSSGQRSTTDFLAGFGSDVFGSGTKKEQMSDTEFRTMSGAGHQHFLGFMKELARVTTADDIRRALLQEWDYMDGRPSMRWDPADYRPHALRSNDPSGDPIRTMRGANRLAIEALPLFPTMPRGGRVRTVGFQERNRESEFTWPIWTETINLATVFSLLAIEELQQEYPSESTLELARRGIAQVFRARRFTDGKYRNFSPAKELL